MYQLIEAKWRIYASMNYDNVVLYNGLLHGRPPCHYLNQCCFIVNWNLRNKFQWNCNRNWNIFIQEKACGNIVWEMAANLSRPQFVNVVSVLPSRHYKTSTGTVLTLKFADGWNYLALSCLKGTHFLANFLQKKNFFCLKGFIWENASICSGNRLVSDRRQAITLTKDDPVHWCHIRSLYIGQWKSRGFVMMPSLLLPMVPQVIVMTTCGATTKLALWQLSIFIGHDEF